MITIGKQLKELRKMHGWTQEFVANRLNIARVNYTRYELDTNCPDFDMLIDIANLYEVPLDALFGRTPPFIFLPPTHPPKQR